MGFIYDGPADDPKAFRKVLGRDGAPELLGEARQALEAVQSWDVESLEAALRTVVERNGVKPGAVFQPIRVAVAGTTISPGIFETLELLGSRETLDRIERAETRLVAAP